MSDLLNKLGKKSTNTAEGVVHTTPASSDGSASAKGELSRGTNLIDTIGAKGSDSTTAEVSQASADNKNASRQVEPSGTENLVDDPDSWSKESSLKEVKKLRDENKNYRLKYQEQIEKLKEETEARIAAKEAEMTRLAAAAAELDRIKAEQEDKKRDLAEKLAHREARLAEIEARNTAREEEYQRKLREQDTILSTLKAEREAEQQVYWSRVEEEVNKIPEKFQDYANLIVKGAGDPREALIAINEAKLKGMFEDKTVVVNHSVPGARDGARVSHERQQEAEKERRASMSSSDKIRSGLQQIKSGVPNSAFRIK